MGQSADSVDAPAVRFKTRWFQLALRRAEPLFLALLILAGTQAQACQIPPSLMEIVRILATLPEERGVLTPALRSRIAEQMTGLSESAVLRELQENGLGGLSATVVDLLAASARIGSGDPAYNPVKIDALLTDLDEQAVLACASGGQAGAQDAAQAYGKRLPTWTHMTLIDLREHAEKDLSFAALAVVSVMSVILLVLLLIDTAVRWAMVLISNRKACLIAAELNVGSHLVEGLVIALSKGGCRFYPLNWDAFEEALNNPQADSFELWIEGERLPARAGTIHPAVIDLRFTSRLTPGTQSLFLSVSRATPVIRMGRADKGQTAE